MGVSARRIEAWIGAVLGMAWPGIAAAAESAGDQQQETLFSGDLGNVFWTGLIFVGLLVVLGKYAWRPMLDALNRREQFIRETIQTAQKDRAEAERLMAEYRQMMARSNQEAQAIIERGRQDAEVVRQQLHKQAQAEADQMIERARQEIGLTRQSALQDLQNLAADLSVEVAGKIIQRSLTDADQQRLVAESLKELAATDNGRIAGNG
jgi:F-type H+-transporting ATPase subunit b